MKILLHLLSFLPMIVFGQNLSIGDTYQGGIIFYLDGNGGGLIAAPFDQAVINDFSDWGCYGTTIAGADGVEIGTGAQNTIDIDIQCETTGIAADICSNLILGGYSDWYLPSIEELQTMYLSIGSDSNIGNFVRIKYWSSSEKDSTNAWTWDFTSGFQDDFSKTSNKHVRAIRSFSISTNLNEYQILNEKEIVKIVDVIGRTSQQSENKPLFYIYDDGTVEKKMIVE